MSRTIQPGDLRAAVNEILEDYAGEVEEAMDKAVRDTATDAVRALKASNPGFADKTYSKGWTKKVTKHRLYSEATVYNKTEGHLTHLLEFGHALRNGGRARAFPHIAPVNDKVPEMFEGNFTEALNI